ncbi:kinase-like domain-containing protein [Tribonema minus]|uniref:Kinase-like domain-containing protein n=1 Tax=Tribonema minus TaxID=303371 RepID=A0A835YK06_9STRA|nr:kinase-like domain-containing protein [Tribonema minus]
MGNSKADNSSGGNSVAEHYSAYQVRTLADAMRESVNLCDRQPRLIRYRKCFVGSDAVRWLVASKHCFDSTEAVRLGNLMLKHGLFHHVELKHNVKDGNFLYRFASDEYTTLDTSGALTDPSSGSAHGGRPLLLRSPTSPARLSVAMGGERASLSPMSRHASLRDILADAELLTQKLATITGSTPRTADLAVFNGAAVATPGSRPSMANSLRQSPIVHCSMGRPSIFGDRQEARGTLRSSMARQLLGSDRERAARLHIETAGAREVGESLSASPRRSEAYSAVLSSRPSSAGKEFSDARVLQYVFKDKWRLGPKIGSGSFGTVHKGLNEETGQIVAVKALPLSASLLQHPHVVQYLGVDFDAARIMLYIFCEWVPGGSLKDLLNDFGPMRKTVARDYARQMLLGLEYLHDNHIIHRDIKSANANVRPAEPRCTYVYIYMCTFGAYISELHMSTRGALFVVPSVRQIYRLLIHTEQLPPLPQHASNLAQAFLSACLIMHTVSDESTNVLTHSIPALRKQVRDQNKRPSAKEVLVHPFLNFNEGTVYGTVGPRDRHRSLWWPSMKCVHSSCRIVKSGVNPNPNLSVLLE